MDGILSDIEVMSNDESILQNMTVDDFTPEQKTKDVNSHNTSYKIVYE